MPAAIGGLIEAVLSDPVNHSSLAESQTCLEL